MSKAFKHKVRHIFYDEDSNLNLRIPFKLRRSYINKIRRNNFDRDIDRAELADKREKASKAAYHRILKEIDFIAGASCFQTPVIV